jgi:hypothetical protein
MLSNVRFYISNNWPISKQLLFWLIVLYVLPKSIWTAPSDGLDPSWQIGLNLALKENLIWGRDIIFTYGPWAFLSTGIPDYASEIGILVFYIFMVLHGFYCIFYIFKNITDTSEILFISVVLFFCGHFLFHPDAMILYFMVVFHMLHYLKYNNLLSLLSVTCCCILAFFIKFNTGIILNFIYIFFLIYISWESKKNRAFVWGGAFFYFIAIYLVSNYYKVDLMHYLTNSIPIINAYNDSMVSNPTAFHTLIGIGIISIFISVLVVNFKKIITSVYEVFVFGNISLLIFISFKQSFVRGDEWHINLFFNIIVFITFLAMEFTHIAQLKKQLKQSIIIIAMLAITSHSLAYRTNKIKDLIGYQLIENFADKFQGITDAAANSSAKQSSVILPRKIKDILGKNSVDVLGSEISIIHFNQLTYNPRPIIQSYSVYDPKLVRINVEKYSGPTAPDYVLYHFGSIDDRHPFWDEPTIYLPLFTNYTLLDTVNLHTFNKPISIGSKLDPKRLILFQRNIINKAYKSITKSVIKDTIVHFGSEINIPKSPHLVYLEIEGDYSLPGAIRRFLYQPSLMEIELTYDNGEKSRHRAILPIMKSGVPINKKVTDYIDAYRFFSSAGTINMNTKSFKLIGNHLWIQNKFRLKFVEYVISDVTTTQ